MHPEDAKSPKWRITGPITILHISPDEQWSLASMTYDGVPNRIGIRWNGDINNRDDLGYPSARGSNGAWFILPDDVAGMMTADLFPPPLPPLAATAAA